MKICLVCASDARGGLEKHVAELATGLAQRGHDVSVVAPKSFSNFIEAPVKHLMVNLNGPRWSPFVKFSLKRMLQNNSWDVVHAHANKAAKLVESIRCQLQSKKFVATLHGCKSNTQAFSTFDDVITVSRSLAGSVRAQRVHVILNGISASKPTAHSSRSWLAGLAGLDDGQPIILGVGRLVPAKGFDRLLEAAAIANVQIVIVGDGPEKEALLELKLKLQAHKVSFLGYRSDISNLLAASDGLVITSYNEGGPYTLVEALLSNRPVLSTAVGMVPEVLPQSLILSNDVGEMAMAISQWTSALPDWNAASSSAMDFAKKNLTLDVMVDATEAVYRGE